MAILIIFVYPSPPKKSRPWDFTIQEEDITDIIIMHLVYIFIFSMWPYWYYPKALTPGPGVTNFTIKVQDFTDIITMK